MTPADEGALRDAVDAIAARLDPFEPAAAALAAERVRVAWRPPRVRVLLLAESHMATTDAELALRVRLPDGVPWPGPEGYVRHVYCAGYGEPELVRNPGGTLKGGTPQYWRLLAFADDPVASAWPSVRRSRTRASARLAAKAALLGRLRDRGVWLTDASLVALAGPTSQGMARYGGWRYDFALKESWRAYLADRLTALDPARVVVIGLGVAAALACELDRAFAKRWSAVRQPNGARNVALRTELHAAMTVACAAD